MLLPSRLMRGLVQVLAVGSILLILLRAPDWTSLFLLVSMIFAAGQRRPGVPKGCRRPCASRRIP